MRAIHWVRDDLRLTDTTALRESARGEALIPAFVLDPPLLSGTRATSARVRREPVLWNRDCTPFARRRDTAVRAELERAGLRVKDFSDRCVLDDVRKEDGAAYSVYTAGCREQPISASSGRRT
jgi:deoxyribodipyrimidine photolyase